MCIHMYDNEHEACIYLLAITSIDDITAAHMVLPPSTVHIYGLVHAQICALYIAKHVNNGLRFQLRATTCCWLYRTTLMQDRYLSMPHMPHAAL